MSNIELSVGQIWENGDDTRREIVVICNESIAFIINNKNGVKCCDAVSLNYFNNHHRSPYLTIS